MYTFYRDTSLKMAQSLIKTTGMREAWAFFREKNKEGLALDRLLQEILALDTQNMVESMKEASVERELDEEDRLDLLDDYIMENLRNQDWVTFRDGAERSEKCQAVMESVKRLQLYFTRTREAQGHKPRKDAVRDVMNHLGHGGTAELQDALLEFMEKKHREFVIFFWVLFMPMAQPENKEEANLLMDPPPKQAELSSWLEKKAPDEAVSNADSLEASAPRPQVEGQSLSATIPEQGIGASTQMPDSHSESAQSNFGPRLEASTQMPDSHSESAQSNLGSQFEQKAKPLVEAVGPAPKVEPASEAEVSFSSVDFSAFDPPFSGPSKILETPVEPVQEIKTTPGISSDKEEVLGVDSPMESTHPSLGSRLEASTQGADSSMESAQSNLGARFEASPQTVDSPMESTHPELGSQLVASNPGADSHLESAHPNLDSQLVASNQGHALSAPIPEQGIGDTAQSNLGARLEASAPRPQAEGRDLNVPIPEQGIGASNPGANSQLESIPLNLEPQALKNSIRSIPREKLAKVLEILMQVDQTPPSEKAPPGENSEPPER